jgi:hypothetical protein
MSYMMKSEMVVATCPWCKQQESLYNSLHRQAALEKAQHDDGGSTIT